MTREEAIIIAARERADRHQIAEMELYKGDRCNYSYGRIYNAEIASFEAGAKWSDENQSSPWISIEKDLPYNHEDLLENENCTKKVLVVLSWNEDPSKKHIEVCDMCNKIGSVNVDFYWRRNEYYTVTHWMRLPELPKE